MNTIAKILGGWAVQLAHFYGFSKGLADQQTMNLTYMQ